MTRTLIAIPALLALAACGGSGGPTTLAPAAGFMGSTDSNTRLSNSGARIRVTIDGETTSVPAGEADNWGTYVGGFDVSDDPDDFTYTLAHVSEGPNSRGTLAITADSDGGNTSVTYDRLASYEVPETGTATATGDYLGYLALENDVSLEGAAISGDVRLNANFNTGTIRGRITDRVLVSGLDGEAFETSGFEDVVLRETSVSDTGRFSGRTTGGGVRDGDAFFAFRAQDGRFKGLVAGDGEVVGGVRIPFETEELSDTDTITFYEIGSFSTGH